MSPTAGRISGNENVDGLMPATPDEVPLLARYVGIVWRRKWIIAAIIVLGVALAVIATLLSTPMYTSTASLEISRQEENIVQVDALQPEVAGVDQEFYQTQYSLLESESLIERVADGLKLVSDPVFIDAFGISPTGGLFSNAEFSRLTPEQRTEVRKQVTEALREHVSISPIRGSRIVNISFTSPNPQLSARIADAWVQGFIRASFDRKLQSSAFAREYLENRLTELRGRLEDSERSLVGYATRNRIITMGSPSRTEGSDNAQIGSIVDANLAALNQAYAEARAARIAAQSRLQGGTSSESLNNQTLTELRQRRAEAAAEYAKLMVTFEPEYPAARALHQQIDEFDRSIAAEERRIRSSLQTTYDEAQRREARLQGAVSELENANLDLRRRGIQYNIYQREVDTNRQLYEALLQRFKEIGLASGIGPNNISVVDPAKAPEDPSSPKLFNNLLYGIIAGLAGAALAVFLLEQVDRKIRSPEDLEELNLPILGVIPQHLRDDRLEVLHDPKSDLSEAYMSVQTRLRLATDHGLPRTLMVTSTRPGEGKSLSSLALAHTLSRSGRSVILIDGDMRSPSVHQELGLRNERGLSDFLSGDEDLTRLILRSAEGNFDAMSAGPVPPNPAELMMAGRFDELLGRLRTSYDHVIVDSPPVLGLADAPLIAEKVEGCIYIVEANNLGPQNIRPAIARLAANAGRIFGIILTQYQAGSSPFNYDYAYHYGYGAEEESGTRA